jgi:hypothetical protein
VLHDFEPVDGTPEPHGKQGALRRLGDVGVAGLQGLAGAAQAGKGLASLASGNTSNAAIEDYRRHVTDGAAPYLVDQGAPKQALTGAQVQADLAKGYSDRQQAANRAVEEAQGFGDTAAAVMHNPSVAVMEAVKAAPSLAAGIAAGPAAPVVFGAQAAGTSAQNVLDKDPNNTAGAYKAAAIAAPVAAATTYLGGKYLTPYAEGVGAKFAGDFVGRAAGVVVDQGTQNAAMGAGSRIGENVGNGEPWSKDVASHIAGDFAVGALGGVMLRPFMGGKSALKGANEGKDTGKPADAAGEAVADPSLGQQGELFTTNPYNVGGHVDAAMQGHDTTIDAGPQGDLFDNQQGTTVPPNPTEAIRMGANRGPQEVIDQTTGVTRAPATTKENVEAAFGAETPFMGHEAATQLETQPITQGELFDSREQPHLQAAGRIQDQQAAAQAAQQQAAAVSREQAVNSLVSKLGPRADIVHEQLGQTVAGAHRFNGQDHGSTPDFTKAVDKLIEAEAKKSPVQHDAEQLLSDAWREDRVSSPDNRPENGPGPYPTMKDIDKLVKLTGINEAPNLAQAAAKIDLAIKKLGFSKAQTSLDKVNILTAWRNKILGGDPNAQTVKSEAAPGAESLGAEQSVNGQDQRSVGQVAERGAAEVQPAAEGSRPAEGAQAVQTAEVPKSQPGDVRAGPAEAAQGVAAPAAKEGGSIKLNRRMTRGRLEGQVQTPAGDVANRPERVGPDAVRPAGELRQPVHEQAGAARDGSVRSEGAADIGAPRDAAVSGRDDGAGRTAEAGGREEVTQPRAYDPNYEPPLRVQGPNKYSFPSDRAVVRIRQNFDATDVVPVAIGGDEHVNFGKDAPDGRFYIKGADKNVMFDGKGEWSTFQGQRGKYDPARYETEVARVLSELGAKPNPDLKATQKEYNERAAARARGEDVREPEEQPAAPAKPDGSAAKNEARDNLWREALKGSKKAERDFEILQDHFVNNLSHRELGEKYGLDHSTVTKLVGEKYLGPRVLAAAHRLGYKPDDIMHMLHDDAPDAPDVRYDKDEHKEKAEDATPEFSDDRRVEGNDLYGNEDRGVMQGMGKIKSPGGSQTNWKDTGDLTDQWLKARDKGDAKKQAELEAKAKEQGSDAWKTSEDRGREAWEKHEETVESGVAYDDLPESLRRDWDEFVENGHGTLADKAKVVDRLSSDEFNESYESRSHEFRGMENDHAPVGAVMAVLNRLGIGHAVDAVDQWHVTNRPDAPAGVISLNRDGTTRITISASALQHEGPRFVQHVVTHEVFHGLDQALHGGVYSMQPEMRMNLVHDEWVPHGAVAKELHDLYSNDPAGGAFEAYFDYPFNRDLHGDLNRADGQAELFAQLGSMYSTERGRAALEQHAPKAAAYMREVVKNVKESPEAIQSRTRDGAAQRAEAFGNRSAEKSGSPESVPGERTELASRGREFKPEPVAKRTERAERVITKLPPPAQGPARAVATTLGSAAKTGARVLAFGHDLADYASHKLGMEAPKKYMNLLSEQAAYRKGLSDELGVVGKDASALKSHEKDAVGRYSTEATTTQKWGYVPDWKPNVTVDRGMQAKFDALPAHVQNVIKAMDRHGNDQLDRLDAANAALKKMLGDDAPQIPVPRLEGPYTPLRRHGDFVVEAKSDTYKREEAHAALTGDRKGLDSLKQDPEHYIYSNTKWKWQADARAVELRRKFGENNVDAMAKSDHMRDNGGTTFNQLAKWKNKIEQMMGETPAGKEYAEAFSKQLNDMYLSAVAESTARQGQMQRRNVAGVEPTEALESFFQNGERHNSFVSGLLHGDRVQKAMAAMQTEVGQGATPSERASRQDIANEFMKRQTAQMNTPAPSRVMDGLMMGNTVWRLLTSPAHYLQYVTQPFTMAAPPLIARHGNRAYGEMTAALMDAARLRKKGSIFGTDTTSHVGRVGDERAALAELQRQGLMDATHDGDYGNPKLFAGKVSGVFQKVTTVMTAAARGLEGYNRIGSALAAYRLTHAESTGRGLSKDAAHAAGIKAAADLIRQAYGDYSAANAPRAFMPGATRFGDATRVVTQFKKFNVIHTALAARMIHESFAGESPADRAVARKAFAYMAGHYALLAGGLGVPFASSLAKAINMVFGEEGDTDETTLRKMIGDEDTADLLLHGAPALLGADVTRKVGAGDIAEPLHWETGSTTKESMGNFLLAVGGPLIGTTAPNILDGVGQMMNGDLYNGLATAMPKGIGDALKAYAMMEEGKTNRRGDVTTATEDIDALDVAMKGLGIPMVADTRAMEQARSVKNVTQLFSEQATDLKKQYQEAFASGDEKARAALFDEWAQMQKEMRDRGLQPPKYSDLTRSPMAKAKREANTINGVQVTRKTRGMVQQMNEEQGAE